MLLNSLTELLLYSQTKNLQEITFINQTGHFTYLKFVQERSNMETQLMDNFLSNLSEDKNGNIITK